MLDFLGVSKSFGAVRILESANFRVNDNDRIGLVGLNGSGKTTMFRLIADIESPDEGSIQRKRGLRVGYLPQEIDPFHAGTVLDEVLKAQPELHRIQTELALLDASLAYGEDDERALQRAMLSIQWADMDGDTKLAKAQELLAGLGFAQGDFGRPLSQLSGGWHMRVYLARLLMGEPDLLLLDEPTNHLDLPSMLWFENYLKGFSGAYVVVSHDREFLNRTVARTVEVENGRLIGYPGNYDEYRRRKEEAIEIQLKNFMTQQAKLRDIEDFIARNRVRKDRARQVQSRLKMMDKIDVLDAPQALSREIDFQFPQPSRSGSMVFKTEKLEKRYGDKVVFAGIDVLISRGDKVAVVGVNGIGKSTLLKIAAQVLAYEGGAAELGHNVTIGYFAQHQLEALDPSKTVYEEILSVSRDETISQLRSLLGAFLFSGDDVEKKVAVLSGGEKSRLALAKMLLKPANFLILDEPTNHLDIASREVLEEALRQYQGTILFASHDRRFIDAIGTRVLEFEYGVPTDYPGNYTDYAWKKSQEVEQRSAALRSQLRQDGPRNSPQGGAESEADRALDQRKERKRREAEMRQEIYRCVKPLNDKAAGQEATIKRLEVAITTLEQTLADPQIYVAAPEKAKELAKTLAQNRREVDRLMDEWMETLSQAESVEASVRERYAL